MRPDANLISLIKAEPNPNGNGKAQAHEENQKKKNPDPNFEDFGGTWTGDGPVKLFDLPAKGNGEITFVTEDGIIKLPLLTPIVKYRGRTTAPGRNWLI